MQDNINIVTLSERARQGAAGAAGMATKRDSVHIETMGTSEEAPVMLPFQDKVGTGWHVIIRYHEGHERRIEGFASEAEAVDWITANSKQVDK